MSLTVAPETAFSNATHIIEGPTSLVVIDPQFLIPYAEGFRAYIDGLEKPIDRVILSHDHPDHYGGLGAAFTDVPVYALPEVRESIAISGQAVLDERRSQFGENLVTDTLVVPDHVIDQSWETIDGVLYRYLTVTSAEAETQLAILLPRLGVMVLQDLTYSGLHIVVPDPANIDSWVASLDRIYSIYNVQKLRGAETDYDLILAGHGAPGNIDVLSSNIAYLETFKNVLAAADNAEEFIAGMIAAYPDLGGQQLLDFIASRLFSE